MNKHDACEAVLNAGLRLAGAGLIVRTWGNVSCRVDGEHFVITPSGRAYETLTPDDIVVCLTADASYSGGIKPSSEKRLHALIYRERKDAEFVIHTHQKYASAAACVPESSFPDLSIGCVPLAAYGLPGSKKLLATATAALPQADHAMLLARHGVLCWGGDPDDAFETALSLEKAYKQAVLERCTGAFDGGREDVKAVASGVPPELLPGIDEIKDAVYKVRKDLCFIEFTSDAALASIAAAGAPLLAMLDDFAQIAGRTALTAKSLSPADVVASLGRRQGILLPGIGALCGAHSQSDAYAVRLVMEKNALAQVYAENFGKARPIPAAECALMRFVYKYSYSKRK